MPGPPMQSEKKRKAERAKRDESPGPSNVKHHKTAGPKKFTKNERPPPTVTATRERLLEEMTEFVPLEVLERWETSTIGRFKKSKINLATASEDVKKHWEDIQEIIGEGYKYPYKVQMYIWGDAFYGERLILMGFFYINGLNPEMFYDFLLARGLKGAKNRIKHYRSIIHTFEKDPKRYADIYSYHITNGRYETVGGAVIKHVSREERIRLAALKNQEKMSQGQGQRQENNSEDGGDELEDAELLAAATMVESIYDEQQRSSKYRTPEQLKAVGEAEGSQHLSGRETGQPQRSGTDSGNQPIRKEAGNKSQGPPSRPSQQCLQQELSQSSTVNNDNHHTADEPNTVEIIDASSNNMGTLVFSDEEYVEKIVIRKDNGDVEVYENITSVYVIGSDTPGKTVVFIQRASPQNSTSYEGEEIDDNSEHGSGHDNGLPAISTVSKENKVTGAHSSQNKDVTHLSQHDESESVKEYVEETQESQYNACTTNQKYGINSCQSESDSTKQASATRDKKTRSSSQYGDESTSSSGIVHSRKIVQKADYSEQSDLQPLHSTPKEEDNSFQSTAPSCSNPNECSCDLFADSSDPISEHEIINSQESLSDSQDYTVKENGQLVTMRVTSSKSTDTEFMNKSQHYSEIGDITAENCDKFKKLCPAKKKFDLGLLGLYHTCAVDHPLKHKKKPTESKHYDSSWPPTEGARNLVACQEHQQFLESVNCEWSKVYNGEVNVRVRKDAAISSAAAPSPECKDLKHPAVLTQHWENDKKPAKHVRFNNIIYWITTNEYSAISQEPSEIANKRRRELLKARLSTKNKLSMAVSTGPDSSDVDPTKFPTQMLYASDIETSTKISEHGPPIVFKM